MKLTTSAQMRELDRIAIEERHIPSVELMDNRYFIIFNGF